MAQKGCETALPSKPRSSVLECCSHQVVSTCETVQWEGFLWSWSRFATKGIFPSKTIENIGITIFQRLEPCSRDQTIPRWCRKTWKTSVCRANLSAISDLVRHLKLIFVCTTNANDKCNSVLQNFFFDLDLRLDPFRGSRYSGAPMADFEHNQILAPHYVISVILCLGEPLLHLQVQNK